jgi:hypothetical protein
MPLPPLTLRQLLHTLGEMPAGGVHDIAQNTHLYDYVAQVRGFLALNRSGVVMEVSPLVFALRTPDTATAQTMLEDKGLDLDGPIPLGELTNDEMRELFRASRPPPPPEQPK